MTSTNLRVGSFVRVRKDHPEPNRAGKDGQVVAVEAAGVALIFENDRHNQHQGAFCAGPEAWSHDELDLTTAIH